MKIMAPWSHVETMETVTDFILGGSKITADGDSSYESKRRLLHGRKAMTNPTKATAEELMLLNCGVGEDS